MIIEFVYFWKMFNIFTENKYPRVNIVKISMDSVLLLFQNRRRKYYRDGTN